MTGSEREASHTLKTRASCPMKIASVIFCEEEDVTDGRLVDVGITSVSAPSYPTPLRKPLVLIVVLEAADIDNELEIYVGLETGDVTTFMGGRFEKVRLLGAIYRNACVACADSS